MLLWDGKSACLDVRTQLLIINGDMDLRQFVYPNVRIPK